MKFSLIVPAHNEERWLGGCLESIRQAAAPYPSQVEVIVVLNRCTDGTEAIARAHGALTLTDDSRCLSKIRNTGAKKSQGEILVTIDADSRMSANMLEEIDRAIRSGKYIGGGAPILPERTSVGIHVTMMALKVFMLITGLAGGVYWCAREDFFGIGGFNEHLTFAEDIDFARRLKIDGRKRRLKFHLLAQTFITTSCRKFDRFGDWLMFKIIFLHGRELFRGFFKQDTAFGDRFYYNFKHEDVINSQQTTRKN